MLRATELVRSLTRVFINGKWVAPSAAATFRVVNPVTGDLLHESPVCDASDVDAAVTAAARAFPAWSRTPVAERVAFLRRIAEELRRRKDDIASVEAVNVGKPLRDAEADIADSIRAFEYLATMAEEGDRAGLWSGVAVPLDAPERDTMDAFIQHEPVGPVAAICPWNYPLMMAAWKTAPALAAGCTIVLKPSELTPFTALMLAQVCESVGVPAGVVNVVTGEGPVGAALSSHPAIRKVTFTGSVPTGEKVMGCAARGVRPVTLELGGKSPAIVFPDANLDTAVEWLMLGVCWNAGQVCSSTARVLVHESVAASLRDKLAEAMACVTRHLGDPFEAASYMGPIVCERQRDRVRDFIRIGMAEGARLVCGGPEPPAGHERGFFIAPTLFEGVLPSMRIFREEIFGPVMTLTTFATEAEAIALANDSEYGLASAVFSEDAATLDRVSREMRAGYAWQNCCQPSPHKLPWGGFGASGVGREMGPDPIKPFLEARSILRHRPSSESIAWVPRD